jgi:hypothetical protein
MDLTPMTPKLKPDSITQSDLIEFLDGHSDFSFEILVLKALTEKGFSCEHGGSYIDRVTRKVREFDIRATKAFGERFLRLAIECKNLRSNSPLLVSCVPRSVAESFHEIAVSVNPDNCPLGKPPEPEVYRSDMLVTSRNFRLTGERSIYKTGDPVGKSCAQVGRAGDKKGDITCNDSGVYEKWSQALSSADDLTYSASQDGTDRTSGIALSIVFPLLVVPNGQLWMTQYDSEGNRIKDPEQVGRCSYFVGLGYHHPFPGVEFTISHLEFVTLEGLMRFVDEVSGDHDKLEATFQVDFVVDRVGPWEWR